MAKNGRLTVMIVSNSDSRETISFCVSKRALMTVIIFSFAVVGMAMFAVFDYAGRAVAERGVKSASISREDAEKIEKRIEALNRKIRENQILGERIYGDIRERFFANREIMGKGGPGWNIDAEFKIRDKRGSMTGTINTCLEDMSEEIETIERSFRSIEISLRKKSAIPVGWPVEGWVSSRYGVRESPFVRNKYEFHAGVDISNFKNYPVKATADGVVIYSGYSKGYGKLVIILHNSGYTTKYGHNNVLLVSEGDYVTKGQAVAKMGSTGRSTGYHVHYEIEKDGKVVNPWKFMIN